jgi:hypothetical protein
MRYQAEDLTIESLHQNDQLVVRWLGRSEDRDPSRTLQPLLDAVCSQFQSAQSVEFDFRALEYMNSSTVRPILHLLQKASLSASQVRVLYDASKTWQRMSFLAIGVALASLGNVKVCA